MFEYHPENLEYSSPKWLLISEKIIACLAFMLYSGGPLNVILSGGYSQGDLQVSEPNYALNSYFFMLSYLLVSALLFIRWKQLFWVFPYGFSIWLMVGFTGLSYFWSDIPSETLSRTIGLVGTTLFGIYLAIRYSPRQQIELLGWAFSLIIFLSLVYALILPQYGVMGGVHEGAWRGIYTHKNTFGKAMTLSSSVFAVLLLNDRKNRPFLGIGLGLSVFLILMSTSVGALVNFIIMLMIIASCWLIRASYRWMVILIGSLILVAGIISLILFINLETLVVDILDKDLTLTGRTDIWISALDMIKIRPWLGYGYQGFWNGLDGASAYIWRTVRWPVPDAHNGFIELLLHLGGVGLAIFLIGYVVNLARSLVKVRVTSGVEFVWYLSFLVYLIPLNIYEQALLKDRDIFWPIYVMISITLFLPKRFEEDSGMLHAIYANSSRQDLLHGQAKIIEN